MMANGWSSREKSRLAIRRVHQAPKQDENSMAVTPVIPSDEEIVDVKPLQVSRDMVPISGPKRSIVRLDSLFCFDVVVRFTISIYLICRKSGT